MEFVEVYSKLYDPLKYIQNEPLVIDTPDFTATIVYKIKEDVLVCDLLGFTSLRECVSVQMGDDFEIFKGVDRKTLLDQIISDDQLTIHHKYPHCLVKIEHKYTNDAVKEKLTELSDIIEKRTLKNITNHR